MIFSVLRHRSIILVPHLFVGFRRDLLALARGASLSLQWPLVIRQPRFNLLSIQTHHTKSLQYNFSIFVNPPCPPLSLSIALPNDIFTLERVFALSSSVHTSACTHTHIHTLHTHTHTHIYTYTHTHIHTYTHTHIHTYIYTYTHTHIHTYTHTHIHTYTHTRIHSIHTHIPFTPSSSTQSICSHCLPSPPLPLPFFFTSMP